MKNKLPKMLAVLGCFFLGGMLHGQTAGNANQEAPVAMPTFSTPEEKQEWMNTHQAEYAKIMEAATANNASMQTSETPAIDAPQQVLPESFPVYVNTGNKQLDDQNYSNAKAYWIANHPVEYEQMKNPK